MPDASTTPGGYTSTFGTMSDSQLRQTISQLQASSAATRGQYNPPYSTTPVSGHPSLPYSQNIQTWSTTAPKPATERKSRRANRNSALAASTSNQASPAAAYQPPPVTQQSLPSQLPFKPNPPRPPLPTAHQALHSSYSSRMRTGTTLLMQPILSTSFPGTTGTGGSGTGTSALMGSVGTRMSTRRGAVINYADPGSGDDLEQEPPDAGAAIDSDDSDFIASGGTRAALRATRGGSGRERGGTVITFNASTYQPPAVVANAGSGKIELDQNYLGMIPPARYITAKPVGPTKHDYPSQEALEKQATRPTALVPIRVEFETDTHRIRDCFVWNLNEELIRPEAFARTLCTDLDLPWNPWADTIANQIKAQLEEHEGAASMDLGNADFDSQTEEEGGEDIPECRVILSIDVQIATYHLVDHIEWDLLSPLSPEVFAQKLCAELGLSGEAGPLIAHGIHEELLKHKKDAIEWGVIGGDRDAFDDHVVGGAIVTTAASRDRSGMSMLKDKTGLGLGWGRAPKDGRGPRLLRSVWRDWADAEEFGTRFQVLTMEEVERKEIERERASRRLRRETSKFQSATTSRRRR